MAKISNLMLAHLLDGEESLPLVKDGATRRARLSTVAAACVPFMPEAFKGLPGSPGEGYGTRTLLAMAGDGAEDLDDAYLSQARYVGKFVFSKADLSVEVAADTTGRYYVAKASDPTGAGGAWVLQREQALTPVTKFGVKRFPAVTAAADLVEAIESGHPLDWLGMKIKLDGPVDATVSDDPLWRGRGAEIVYDGEHAACAIRVTAESAVRFDVSGLTVNGNDQCNIALMWECTAAMASASTMRLSNVRATGVSRSNAHAGVPAMGMAVQGSFSSVEIVGGGADDCKLPTDTGSASNYGVSGIGIAPLDDDRWVRRCIIHNIDVRDVRSTNPAYVHDQDGFAFFAPNDATHPSGKKESFLLVTGSRFENCYGRSIKTQCRSTVVRQNVFVRNEGFTRGFGNMETDIQAGTGTVTDNEAYYSNGQHPGFFARNSLGLVANRAGIIVENNEIFLDADTVMHGVVQLYAATGQASIVRVAKNRVNGSAMALLDYAISGAQNIGVVHDNWIAQLEERTDLPDQAGEVAGIWVRKAGLTASARINAQRNIHAGIGSPAILRTQVPNGEMVADPTALDNLGFADDPVGIANPAGMLLRQLLSVAGIVGLGDHQLKGDFGIETKMVADGATVSFPMRKVWGNALVIVLAGYAGSGNNYLILSTTNSVNTVLLKSAAFEVGDTTNPGTGDFNVFSDGPNSLAISNEAGGATPVTVFRATLA